MRGHPWTPGQPKWTCLIFTMRQRVSIYHNLLWSKYKGAVFSEVYAQSGSREIETSFIQVAETDVQRVQLGQVDLSFHRYPFRLLIRGAYTQSSLWLRIFRLAFDLIRYPADLVVLPNYHRIEYWVMLVLCIVMRRRRAVFCESTIYDSIRSSWKETAKAVFFSRCDGFFCYGIRSKEYVLSYGMDEQRIFDRCQAAALPADYDPQQVAQHYQTSLTHWDESPMFLYVGRLSAEKGLEDLLDALVIVRSSMPTATLTIVGDGWSRDALVARTRTLGLQDTVFFVGSKDIREIAALLMRSVALVLPSHKEPWGLVVNESLSYGCPVVVSRVCGCVPELVIEGVTGFTFEVANVAALAKALFAAVELSASRLDVSKRCLDLISSYTPKEAGAHILEGCRRILQGD